MIAALLWDSQNVSYPVFYGSVVRFHFVNVGAFGYFHIWMEGHTMIVIEVAGVYIQPYTTSGIELAVGQRISVLVTMGANPAFNYPIVAAMGLSTCVVAKNRPGDVR
jgi:FtsP/CotA-like multicopper oxidase with cupredoxin domain